jgi:Ca2+-binding RTX toxin-like protein
MAISVNQDNATPPAAGTQSDMTAWDLSGYDSGTVTASTGTTFRIVIGTVTWTFHGTGFTYDGNNLLDTGTIEGFEIEEGGTVWADVSDFTMNVNSVFKPFMNTNNTSGFQHEVFENDDEIDGAYHAIGYEGNDTITNAVIAEGGSGEDTITLRSSANTQIDGGIGSDTIIITNGLLPAAQVTGGSGTDTIMGRWKVDTIFRGGDVSIERMGDAVIKGTNGNQRIDLHEMEKDPNGYTKVVIKAKGGNDDIFAVSDGRTDIFCGDGNDHVHGSDEGEYINGGDGNDHLISDFGDDTVEDFKGDSFIRTAEGNDIINVADGGDIVFGNENDDVITSTGVGTGTVIDGGSGNDILSGEGDLTLDGNQADDIIIIGVGNATVLGDLGDDIVRMNDNDNLNSGDDIDGQSGTDVVELNEATAAPYTVDTALKNIEILRTEGGTIVMNDVAVVSGAVLIIEGGIGAALEFDGTAETNGSFHIFGTDDDDILFGGDRDDEVHAGEGVDVVRTGDGDDTILFNQQHPSTLEPDDIADGGDGNDTLVLGGLYGDGNALTFDAFTIISIETLFLEGGSLGPDPFKYHLTFDNGNIASGDELTVDSTELHGDGRAIIDGSDVGGGGRFIFLGGDGIETFIGGGSRDEFTGGSAGDQLTGNGGGDLFNYHLLDDSTSRNFDTITGFDASEDQIGFEFAVGDVETAVEGGSLSRNTFDNNMENAIGAGELGVGNAVLFSPDAGFYSGHLFLVVDANGQAGYQGEEDYVIEVTGMSNIGSLDNAFTVI